MISSFLPLAQISSLKNSCAHLNSPCAHANLFSSYLVCALKLIHLHLFDRSCNPQQIKEGEAGEKSKEAEQLSFWSLA